MWCCSASVGRIFYYNNRYTSVTTRGLFPEPDDTTGSAGPGSGKGHDIKIPRIALEFTKTLLDSESTYMCYTRYRPVERLGTIVSSSNLIN